MTTSNTNPYQLTVTRAIRTDVIKTDVVKQAIVDKNQSRIYEITSEHRGVGEFEHPLLFKTPAVDGWRVAIDVRPFNGSSPIVKEQLELLRRRAALTLHCAEGGSEDLFESGLLLAYVNIVQGILAKRFSLDPLTKMHMVVVAAAFYYFITRPEEQPFEEDAMLVIAKQCVRQLRLPPEMVDGVLSRVEPGRSLDVLVKNIKEIEGTDRTVMLTPALMINACSGLWFGVNVDAMLGIMLEHPPTWAAMIYDATGDGTYSRVELARRLKTLTPLRQKIPHLHAKINQIITKYDMQEEASRW